MTNPHARLLTPVLVASCIILLVGFGIRASFGLFQIPIAEQFGWPRADFSMAIAIQNLAWGIGQPIFGAIAERFGDRRAIALGALLYAVGLALSAFAVTPGGAPAPQRADRLRHRRHRLRGDPRDRRPRRLARAPVADPRHRHRRRLRRPGGRAAGRRGAARR